MSRNTKFSIIENVVKESRYTKISMLVGTKRRLVILDIQTANALYKLFNSATEENKVKLESLPWNRLLVIAWSNNND